MHSKYLQVQLTLLGLTKVPLQVMGSNTRIAEIRIVVRTTKCSNTFLLHFSLGHFFRIALKQDSKVTPQPSSETGSLRDHS